MLLTCPSACLPRSIEPTYDKGESERCTFLRYATEALRRRPDYPSLREQSPSDAASTTVGIPHDLVPAGGAQNDCDPAWRANKACLQKVRVGRGSSLRQRAYGGDSHRGVPGDGAEHQRQANTARPREAAARCARGSEARPAPAISSVTARQVRQRTPPTSLSIFDAATRRISRTPVSIGVMDCVQRSGSRHRRRRQKVDRATERPEVKLPLCSMLS